MAVARLNGRPVVVSGGDHGTVRVWELASGAPVGEPFNGHVGAVWSVAVGELDARPVVVSGGEDGTVRVWDLATGAPVGGPLTRTNGAAYSVAVGELASRPVVVSGGEDGTVRVWDLATGAPVGDPFTGHTGTVLSVAVARLNRRSVVISGGGDGTVRMSDLATGAPVGDPLTGHEGAVWSVTVAELDGRHVLLSGGKDGTVRVWDLAKRRALRHLLRPILLRHSAQVLAAVVAYRRRLVTVVTACSDKTIWTWDLATCQSLSRIAIHGQAEGSAIALRAQDQVLYANGGTLSLYAETPDEAPVLRIELDSEVLAVATHRTSVVAATRLGLVALDIPE